MEEQKKPTYEQLEQMNAQLYSQLQNLQKTAQEKINDLSMYNTFKRLDYLFKVLETCTLFPTEFVEKCATEIGTLLTIPEADNSEEGKNGEAQ